MKWYRRYMRGITLSSVRVNRVRSPFFTTHHQPQTTNQGALARPPVSHSLHESEPQLALGVHPERHAGVTMTKGLWIRLLIWVPLLALAIGYRVMSDSEVNAERVAAAPIEKRHASVAEWQLPITELGERKLAKLLTWRELGEHTIAAGDLIWFHDGKAERVGYLPAPGEHGPTSAARLMLALREGKVALWEFHGDPTLKQRMNDLLPAYELPTGWALLQPPLAESGSEPAPATAPAAAAK